MLLLSAAQTATACSSYPAPCPQEGGALRFAGFLLSGTSLETGMANAWERDFMNITKNPKSYLVTIFTIFSWSLFQIRKLQDGTKRGASIHHVGTGKGERVNLLHHYQKFKVLFKPNDPCQ